MYSGAHFAGEEIPRLAVVGITDNSEEMDVLFLKTLAGDTGIFKYSRTQ